METLKNSIDSLKKSSEEAKEQAEGLKNALNGYEESVNILNKCVVGTVEWKDALEGVQTSISNLLEQYPELKKFKDIFKWDESTQSYILNVEKVEEEIAKNEQQARAESYAASKLETTLIREEAKNDMNKRINSLTEGINSSQGI